MNSRVWTGSDVRREQELEGSRMARDDREQLSRPTVRRPSKPKQTFTGHEAFLKQLEQYRSPITVIYRDGGESTGTVRCSDKFTITLRVEAAPGAFHEWVIFKHDISRFRALQPRPDKQVTADEE